MFSLVNAAAAVVFNESAYDKVGGCAGWLSNVAAVKTVRMYPIEAWEHSVLQAPCHAGSQVGTIMAPAVLASRVVLHQVDTLTLVVGAVGWFLSYELPVRILFTALRPTGAR